MRNIFVAAAALSGLFAALVPTQSFALDVNILGRVGYDSIQSEKEDGDTEDPKPLTGFDLGVMAQVSFLDLTVASLYGGAGLSYISVSRSEGDNKFSESLIVLPLEAGVSFKALPLLTLQGAVGYDLGLSGSGESKSALGTSDIEITSHGAVTLTARAMMSVLPFMMGGLEFQYMPSGSQEFKLKDFDNAKGKGDITGYAIRLVAGFGI